MSTTLEERFDALHADLSEAVGAGDLTAALYARRLLTSTRAAAAALGVDIEEEGCWMVPSARTVREQVERMRA